MRRAGSAEDEVEIFQAQSSFPTFDDEQNNSKEEVSTQNIEELHRSSPNRYGKTSSSDGKKIQKEEENKGEEEEKKHSDEEEIVDYGSHKQSEP